MQDAKHTGGMLRWAHRNTDLMRPLPGADAALQAKPATGFDTGHMQEVIFVSKEAIFKPPKAIRHASSSCNELLSAKLSCQVTCVLANTSVPAASLTAGIPDCHPVSPVFQAIEIMKYYCSVQRRRSSLLASIQ